MAKPLARAPNSKYWAVEPSKAVNGSPAGELWLYGIINDEKFMESDVTPYELVNSLNALGEISELNVHLFSDGGDVFAGNAIYSMLKQRREPVNIYIEGVAASIASVIAMAGDTTYIAKNAVMLIHNPMLCLFGMYNKIDMAKMIDDLDRVRDVAMQAYTDKTGIPPEEIHAMLDANGGEGTWLNAEQAVAGGFADAVTPDAKKPKDMVAMVRPGVYACRGREVDLTCYKNAPDIVGFGTKRKGGLNKVAAKKQAKDARRGKYKAELVSIECPHCGAVVDLDTANNIVTMDPAEDATVAVPTEETVTMRGGKHYRNESWKITCPECGEEFEYTTETEGAITTAESDDGFADDPIPQAKRGKPAARQAKRKMTVKNVRKGRMRMEGEDAIPEDTGEPIETTITCPDCGEDIVLDIDPSLEEGVFVCPICGAELTVETGLNAGGNPAGGSEDDPGPEEDIIVAFRKGMQAERKRVAKLDEISNAFPEYRDAMDRFRRNGSSVMCAYKWITRAKNANQRADSGRADRRAAARRDAAPLNKLGRSAPADNRHAAAVAEYNGLAKKRGTLKDA